MPKKPIDVDLDIQEFFRIVAADLTYEFTETPKNIIEFIEEEIDKEKWGIELNIRQLTLLKAFYNLDMTDEEISILESWREQDRTTWEPLKLYQSLICECGRRGSKCESIRSSVQTQLGCRYMYEILAEKLGMPKNTSYVITDKGLLNLNGMELKPGENISIQETVAIEGKNKTAIASNFYVKGNTKTKIITTACGYEIEATPEHRIKVIDEKGNIVWRYFEDIKEGEYACIHRATNIFPKEYLDCSKFIEYKDSRKKLDKGFKFPEVVGVSVGKLLGLLVGDGSWNNPNVVELSLHEDDLDYYKSILEENNLLNYINQSFDRRSKHGFRLTIYSSVIRKFYTELGFVTDSTPRTKKVPWAIRRSPKDVQAAFLSNLFAADGCLGKGGRDISLSTASKYLAQEVQLMLLNFDIISKVVTRKVNGSEKGNDYYWVILRGKRSLQRFADEITFGLSRKQEPLVEYLSKSSRDGGDTERIPYQKEWLVALRDTLPSNRGKQPGSKKGLLKDRFDPSTLKQPKLRNLKLEYRAIVGNSIKENSGELLSSYRLDELIKFAEEFCTNKKAIEHFKYIRDCDYFYDPIISVVDSEAFCVDLTVPGQEQYVSQGFTNHNSSTTSIIVVYEFYRLCALKNPHKHYGIGSSTPISILVLATSAQQSKRTIFGNIIGMMRVCRYFKQLIESGRIFVGKEEIRYDEKLLSIYSGNSQSSGQVGQSVILLVMDEVARFKDVDGNSNALELWSNLGVSGVTFGRDAKRIAISSAWYTGDAIERLYETAKTEDSWLGFRLRTWDLNPAANRENPLITSEYNLNYSRAALEFEGIRTAGENAFFDFNEVKRAFRGKEVIKYDRNVKCSDGLIRNYIKEIERDSSIGISVIHLDPSIIKDTYGLALGHIETNIEGKSIVIIDAVIGWNPEPGYNVSITNVQECIREINNSRQIYKVTSDHHNSSETIERLRSYGIPAQAVFFSNKMQLLMYECVRLLLHEDRLVLPKDTLTKNQLLDEFSKVQLIKGTKIDHTHNSSKDLCDSIAGVCWELIGKSMYTNIRPTLLSVKSNKSSHSFSEISIQHTNSNNRRNYLNYKNFIKSNEII